MAKRKTQETEAEEPAMVTAEFLQSKGFTFENGKWSNGKLDILQYGDMFESLDIVFSTQADFYIQYRSLTGEEL